MDANNTGSGRTASIFIHAGGQLRQEFTLTQAPAGQIENVRIVPRLGTKLFDVYYDLWASTPTVSISVTVSTDGGASFTLPVTSLSGDGYGPSVVPGVSRHFVWDAGADWPNQVSDTVQIRVSGAGTTATSPSFHVDTRSGGRPIVVDVTSRYCNALQHAYFLAGVSLPLEFSASVEWNGNEPGTLRFNGFPQPGTDTEREINVGNLGLGGTLEVVAVAADGTESRPYRANFDVITPPPGIPSEWLYVKPLASTLAYTTPEYSFNVLDSHPEKVAANVPFFGGQRLGYVAAAKASAEVVADGTACAQVSAGTGTKFPMAGFDIVPRLTGRPEWTYSPQTRQWIPSGYLGLEASGSQGTPPAYIAATPPLYLRADVDIDTAVQFGIEGWDVSGRPILNGKWDFNAQVTGVAGEWRANIRSADSA